MTSYRMPVGSDPVGPSPDQPLTIWVDGEPVTGTAGQTIAGVLLDAGRRHWRTTRDGAPRGAFCGIGVCFDCLVEVNGLRDVRACLRRAQDGDAVADQGGSSSGDLRLGGSQSGGSRTGESRLGGSRPIEVRLGDAQQDERPDGSLPEVTP